MRYRPVSVTKLLIVYHHYSLRIESLSGLGLRGVTSPSRLGVCRSAVSSPARFGAAGNAFLTFLGHKTLLADRKMRCFLPNVVLKTWHTGYLYESDVAKNVGGKSGECLRENWENWFYTPLFSKNRRLYSCLAGAPPHWLQPCWHSALLTPQSTV